MDNHSEEHKEGPVHLVFQMPYVLQQILQFAQPRDLILKLHFLSKSARAAIYSENQFFRWYLKNSLIQLETKESMAG